MENPTPNVNTHFASSRALPPIPQKRYFTIGEVASLCSVKTHVLRYWEQEFSQLRPTKRRGNRRYYQTKDVILIRQIYQLLYEQGFTISGARQYLKSKVQQQELKSLPLQTVMDELEAILESLHKALES